MRFDPSCLPVPFLIAVAAWLAVPPASADEISRATITVDATAADPVVTSRVTWTADMEGGPRAALTLWLAPGVRPTGASADGRALEVAEAGESYGRRGWKVTLPSPLRPGESRSLEVVATVSGRGVPGIGTSESGGRLLPGSGWFPATAPEVDERLAHSIELVLPEAFLGVATGDATGGHTWATTTAARPYAVWGDLRREETTLGDLPAIAWRPSGAEGPLPRAERVAALLDAVTSGIGDLPGTGRIKLVHAGGGIAAGGLQTLFWDEAEAAAPGTDRDALLLDRDLAGGWAAAAWAEDFRFDGDQAAFLSRAIPLDLGDAAVVALDRSDDTTPTERVVIGSRRADFLSGRESGDRALEGLAPAGAGSAWVLATRGALVAHLVAEACPTRSSYISFLRGFRERYAGGNVNASILSHELGREFPNQHAALDPFFRTTGLPAFRIVDHGPDEPKGTATSSGERYRVQVENTGEIAAAVELSTFTAEGFRLRSFRTFLEPGQTRGVVFRDVGRTARVELDPRGVVPQSRLEDQSIELQRPTGPDLGPFVPAFRFTLGTKGFAEVKDLDLDLASVSIRGFNGYVQWWETHHGPSGAVLLGEGDVEIRPDGEQAAAFRERMGKDALSFRGSEMFLRFPVDAWARIEPQLGEIRSAAEFPELTLRRRQIYEHSFPTYFFEDSRAQVPAPGSALVLFSLEGDERRAWLRRPLPDGTVQMRLWDHLRGETIWEDTR